MRSVVDRNVVMRRMVVITSYSVIVVIMVI